jgi:hypothetical protein
MFILPVPGDTFYSTPIFWQKFVEHIQDSHLKNAGISYYDMPNSRSDDLINLYLSEYKATMIQKIDADGDLDIASIEFESDNYMTLFLLKFS